jgi:hypothetical protein
MRLIWYSGWCWDESSCAGRSGNLISSSDWSTTWNGEGILNASDARFQGANLVFAPYCSSDAWIGHKIGTALPSSSSSSSSTKTTTISSPSTWHFQGHEIIKAVFASLASSHGLGSLPNTRVMYTGCSAGARGVLYNAHSIYSFLPASHSCNISRVGLFIDSAMYINLEPFVSGPVSFIDQCKSIYNWANVSATIDPTCAQYYNNAPHNCLMGQYAAPFLITDFFTNTFLYDAFQLDWNLGLKFLTPPQSPAQFAFAETFRGDIHDAVLNASLPRITDELKHKINFIHSQFPILENQTSFTPYAMMPACLRHCNTQTDEFNTLTVNNVTLNVQLAAWFFQDNANIPNIVQSTCREFNCCF